MMLLGDCIRTSYHPVRHAERLTGNAARECGVDVPGNPESDGMSSTNDTAGRRIEVRRKAVSVKTPEDLSTVR